MRAARLPGRVSWRHFARVAAAGCWPTGALLELKRQMLSSSHTPLCHPSLLVHKEGGTQRRAVLTFAPDTLVLGLVVALEPGLALGHTGSKLAILGREATDGTVEGLDRPGRGAGDGHGDGDGESIECVDVKRFRRKEISKHPSQMNRS